MQHVIQVAFDFDDARIAQIVEKTGAEKVREELKQMVIDELFAKTYRWGSNGHGIPENGFNDWVKDEVRSILEENKADICKLAAQYLAESMRKTKKYQEMVMEEVKNG